MDKDEKPQLAALKIDRTVTKKQKRGLIIWAVLILIYIVITIAKFFG